MRHLVVVALLFFAAGCGDDSSCATVQANICTDAACCDPMCKNALEGLACSPPGYECQLFESACTCDATDHLWHCHGDVRHDLSIPQDLSSTHGEVD